MDLVWYYQHVLSVLKLIVVPSKTTNDLEVHHALRKLELRHGRWIRMVDIYDHHDGRVLGRDYLVRGHGHPTS